MEGVCLDAVPEPLQRKRSVDLLWTTCVVASGSASLIDPCVQLQDLASSSLPLLAILNFPNPKIRAGLHPDKELLPGQRERQRGFAFCQAKEGRAGFESGGWRHRGCVNATSPSPEHPLTCRSGRHAAFRTLAQDVGPLQLCKNLLSVGMFCLLKL